jgi:chemotaxis protein CheX
MPPECFIMQEHLSEQLRIAKDVFGTMVDINIHPTEDAWPPDSELVTSAVYFTDPWKGALIVECTVSLAFAFTSRFMSVDTPTAVDDDVCDAMGELSNMIAGNLKALMPSSVGISIPSVVRGRDYVLRLRGTESLTSSVFSTEFGQFCLTLVGTATAATESGK